MTTEQIRTRHRSTFIVRWDAIITVIVASLASFALGSAATFAVMSPLLER